MLTYRDVLVRSSRAPLPTLEIPKVEVPEGTSPVSARINFSNGHKSPTIRSFSEVGPTDIIPGQTFIALKYRYLDLQLCNKKTTTRLLTIVPTINEWIPQDIIHEHCANLRLNIERQLLNKDLVDSVKQKTQTLEPQEQQELEWRMEILKEEFEILMWELRKEMKRQEIQKVQSGKKEDVEHFVVEVVGRGRLLRLKSENYWGAIELDGEEEMERLEREAQETGQRVESSTDEWKMRPAIESNWENEEE